MDGVSTRLGGATNPAKAEASVGPVARPCVALGVEAGGLPRARPDSRGPSSASSQRVKSGEGPRAPFADTRDGACRAACGPRLVTRFDRPTSGDERYGGARREI